MSDMKQFKQDIFYHAICIEHDYDFLGDLTNFAKWSISNQGASVNEKTPAMLRDEILNAIERIKKLKLLLKELEQSGYTIKGGPQHPEYDLYNVYFKKVTADARTILRKFNPFLKTSRVASVTFLLGDMTLGY